MIFYIYVFSSRNESTAFYNYLKARGVGANLIATPKECMTGCGLSVKVTNTEYNRSNNLFEMFEYKYTFKGVFRTEKVGISNKITRIR